MNRTALPGAQLQTRSTLPPRRLQAGDAGHASWPLRLVQVGLRAVFRLVFHVRVAGRGNIPLTPVIICANHLTWVDPFLILLFFPAAPRIYVLSDHNAVAKSGFRRRVVDALGLVVPLDPGQGLAALHTLADILERGGSLLIFPEGIPWDATAGVIRPLHPGAAYLSVTCGVPILPVGLTSAKELWLRRRLVVRVGRPLDLAALPGPRRARVESLTAALARALHALMPPDRDRSRIRLLRRRLTKLLA
jgi:1-acyl-sn-glycerol-3-phosphate acyltransferase